MLSGFLQVDSGLFRQMAASEFDSIEPACVSGAGDISTVPVEDDQRVPASPANASVDQLS